jgi:hypothetical protein
MKKYTFCILKVTEERESDPELVPDPDPLVIEIRIRNKMSLIPNTAPKVPTRIGRFSVGRVPVKILRRLLLGAARPTVAAVAVEQGRQRRASQHRRAISVAVGLSAAAQQGRQSAAGEREVGGGGGGGGGGARIATDHGFSHRVHHRDSRLQQILLLI